MFTPDAVRFVVGSNGKPTAAQIDIDLWQQILAALEDAEDVALARDALAELIAAGGDPDHTGWTRLEDVLEQWHADDAL